MDTVVVTIGGSVVAPAKLDTPHLESVAQHIQEWTRKHRVFVVVGGGNPARKYIEAARELKVCEEELDRLGVQATRLNAQLITAVLDARGMHVSRDIPTTVEEAASKHGDVVVMGGTTPGHSTDYVGAELAARVGGRLIVVTNVDGVYTSDPNKDPDAEHKPKLTFDELLQIIEEEEWTTAGAPGVIDGPATVLIATNGIQTSVVKGDDFDNITKAIEDEPFHGTRVDGAKVVL